MYDSSKSDMLTYNALVYANADRYLCMPMHNCNRVKVSQLSLGILNHK